MADDAGVGNDDLARRTDEVEAMQAIYDDTLTVHPSGVDASIRLEFQVPLDDHTDPGVLHVTLTPTYPTTTPTIDVIRHPALSRAAQADLVVDVSDLAGDECVMEVYGRAKALLCRALSHAAEEKASASAALSEARAAAAAGARRPCLGRRLIWFHHIKSGKKKTFIRAEGRRLGLAGAFKPGYPGILFVEGDNDACEEYVSSLRALRWKAMALRGEQRIEGDDGIDVDSLRVWKGDEVEELPENGLGILAAKMEDINLKDFFFSAAMKMKK